MEWLSAYVENSVFLSFQEKTHALDLGVFFCVKSPVLYLVDITGCYKIGQFDVSKSHREAFVIFPAATHSIYIILLLVYVFQGQCLPLQWWNNVCTASNGTLYRRRPTGTEFHSCLDARGSHKPADVPTGYSCWDDHAGTTTPNNAHNKSISCNSKFICSVSKCYTMFPPLWDPTFCHLLPPSYRVFPPPYSLVRAHPFFNAAVKF